MPQKRFPLHGPFASRFPAKWSVIRTFDASIIVSLRQAADQTVEFTVIWDTLVPMLHNRGILYLRSYSLVYTLHCLIIIHVQIHLKEVNRKCQDYIMENGSIWVFSKNNNIIYLRRENKEHMKQVIIISWQIMTYVNTHTKVEMITTKNEFE